MIVLLHKDNIIVDVFCNISKKPIAIQQKTPLNALFELAELNEDRILVWCHENQKGNINLIALTEDFHLKNMMMSYATVSYLPDEIGYVEDSPFINVNKSVKYPTWMMSSNVGAIHSSQLIKFKGKIKLYTTFDYALNSIAKLGMPNGLLCYSNLKLLKDNSKTITNNIASKRTLFKFVKQHYKTRWLFLLLLNFIFYNKKFLFLSFFKSIFYKKRRIQKIFKTKLINNHKKNDFKKTIDVIIPTIGRKEFLHDVLKDLSFQTLLPKQVIIVEQNPEPNGKSNLDYLSSEKWPFKIVHKFINQTGACNARNVALKSINSKFVFFADDDIRFNNDVLQKATQIIVSNNFEAVTLSCLQKGELEINRTINQWSSFGSGCSIVTAKAIEGLTFDLALEHGFGEDSDFGMQLRNKGKDILYLPHVSLLHLKAPIGGFRKKIEQPWDKSLIKPKPSPTVMYNRLKNNSKYQLLGYKTVLFFKYYKSQSIKNPISYLKTFRKQWEQSVTLANELKNSIS